MKAREVKRAKLVAKYAAKRAQLKAKVTMRLCRLYLKCFSCTFAQPLQDYRTSERVCTPVRYFSYPIA